MVLPVAAGENSGTDPRRGRKRDYDGQRSRADAARSGYVSRQQTAADPVALYLREIGRVSVPLFSRGRLHQR